MRRSEDGLKNADKTGAFLFCGWGVDNDAGHFSRLGGMTTGENMNEA